MLPLVLFCSKRGSEPGKDEPDQPDAVTPIVDSLSIAGGWPADVLIIYGSKFGETRDSSIVTFDTVKATDFINWCDSQIVMFVPASAVSGEIVVTVNGELSKGIPFVVYGVYYTLPEYGQPGTQVEIHGAGFGQEQGDDTVFFGDYAAEVLSWSDTLVLTIVPADIPLGETVVHVGQRSTGQFRVTSDDPEVDEIAPDWGPRGTEVQIRGVSFGQVQGSSVVKIGYKTVTEVLGWTDSLIVIKIPPDATPGHISVEVDDVQSNAILFTVYALDTVTPTMGAPGDLVNIWGYGFGQSQGDNYVRIGSAPAHIWSWGANRVKALIPEQASSDTITIGVRDIEQSWTGFKILRPFQITGVYPDSGFYGDRVTILGSGFGDIIVTDAVTFAHRYVRRAAGRVYFWSDTVIVAEVPDNAVSGELIVVMGDYTASGGHFKVFGVGDVTVPWGRAGFRIEIEGAGFGDVQNDNLILFEDTVGMIYEWSDAKIITALPNYPLNGTMRFIFNGVEILSKSFRVMKIEEVTPDWAVWGDEVAIRGKNFGNQWATVWIGGTVSPILYFSDTLVTATVAEGSTSGFVQMRIQGRETDMVPIDVFQVTRAYPFWGIEGDTISVTGTGFRDFDATSRMILGGEEAEIVYWYDTLAVALVPPYASGNSLWLSTHERESNDTYFLVREYPAVFDLLAATNRIELQFDGMMQFTYRTECTEISLERFNPPWYIDSLSGGFAFGAAPRQDNAYIGLISADGNTLDSLFCYRISGRVWPGPGCDEIQEFHYIISIADVELSDINEEDTVVVYRASGPSVQQHITYVDMFERWRDCASGWVVYWRYVDTDWNNTECPPSITITFYRQ